MNQVKDFTKGPLFSQIIFFSLPIIATNLLQIMFNMTDIAVVGQFAGPIALGSVGSTISLNSLFVGMIIGFGGGINIVIAFQYGTKNTKNISEAVHSSFIISAIFGLIFLFFSQLFLEILLSSLHTKPEFFDGALLYLRVLFFGLPALAIYNCGNAILSASGNTRKALTILSISGIINVLLNLFFVLVLKIDVLGVAIASVISQYLSAVLIIFELFFTKAPHQLKFHNMKLTSSKVKSILKMALPYSAQNGIFHIANLFFQFGVNSFDTILVAGNTAAMNADTITYSIMSAFYTASGSFIGQNLGCKNKTRITKSYLYCLILSVLSGTFIFGLICLFGKQFLSIFCSNPDIVQAGLYRLYFLGIPYGITAVMDCTTASSRALGHGIIPTIIIIFGSCIFRIFWIFYIFPYFNTIQSLYVLYPISWTITAIAQLIFFIYIYNKSVKQMF